MYWYTGHRLAALKSQFWNHLYHWQDENYLNDHYKPEFLYIEKIYIVRVYTIFVHIVTYICFYFMISRRVELPFLASTKGLFKDLCHGNLLLKTDRTRMMSTHLTQRCDSEGASKCLSIGRTPRETHSSPCGAQNLRRMPNYKKE